jgi:hypothetical protein
VAADPFITRALRHSSNETVEIFVEADFETLPEGRRTIPPFSTFRRTCLARQRRHVVPQTLLPRDFGIEADTNRA